MVKSCCVKYCKSESYAGCGISFHKFPKDEDRKKKWLDIVTSSQKITKNSVVCSNHFKKEDFHEVCSRQLLKEHVIPSIFPLVKTIRKQLHTILKIMTRLSKIDSVKLILSEKSFFAFVICILIYIGAMLMLLSDFHAIHRQVIQSSPSSVINVYVLPATTYKSFLQKYNKSYNTTELVKRFAIFKNSLKELSRMDHDTNAVYGLTKFADVDITELFPRTSRPPLRSCEVTDKPCSYEQLYRMSICEDFHRDKSIPDKFDWRDSGKVGPMLNQKQCNGCWAFSIVGVMETMEAIKHNTMFGVRRSIQELIDCSTYTEHCTGGHVARGLKWLCDEKWGVVTEDQYPLKLVTDACTLEKFDIPEGSPRVKQYCQLCNVNEDEEDILRLIYFHGPVMVVVNAEPWRFYIDGVIQRACERRGNETIDHVVQIVGYDRSDSAGVPHYIVRNSWGDDFGAWGYVKLEIGKNICGVADEYLGVYMGQPLIFSVALIASYILSNPSHNNLVNVVIT